MGICLTWETGWGRRVRVEVFENPHGQSDQKKEIDLKVLKS